jgi:hypothetical protein
MTLPEPVTPRGMPQTLPQAREMIGSIHHADVTAPLFRFETPLAYWFPKHSPPDAVFDWRAWRQYLSQVKA